MSEFRRRLITLAQTIENLFQGYTRLRYVDNQGAAYCSSGIHVSEDMTFDLNICVYQAYSTDHYMIAGSSTGNFNQSRQAVGLRCTNNKLYAIYRLQLGGSTTLITNEWYNLSLKEDGFYKDDTLFQSIDREPLPGRDPSTFFIGSFYTPVVTPRPHYQLIGNCIINDTTFIPVRRNSDNTAGFLKLPDGTFLTSNSSTPFLAGPDLQN